MPVTTPTIWKPATIIANGSSSVAALADGRIVIAGTSFDASNDPTGVFGRTFDIFGNLQSGDFLSGSNFSGERFPELVTLSNGDLAVATNVRFSETDTDVRVDRFAADDLSSLDSTTIDSSDEGDFLTGAVALPDSDGYAVTFSRDDDVWVAIRNDGGTNSTFRANANPADFQQNGDIAALDDGNVVVVWENFVASTSTRTIRAVIYDQAGNVVATERPVGATGNAAIPAVTTLENGNFVVAWQDVSAQKMYYQVYGPDFSEVSPLRSISDPFGIVPKLVALNDGGFVMSWSSYVGVESDGSPDGDVAIQRLDASGTPIGAQFRIDLPGDQTLSDITTTPDGRLIVVYDTETGDSTDEGRNEFIILDPRGSAIEGTDESDVIAGRLDGSSVRGLLGDDTLYGLDGEDMLDGGDGDDLLNGRAGDDVMSGGTGDDTYFVYNPGDEVVERAFQGAADRVASSIDYALGANAEIEILGTTRASGFDPISLTGNRFAQTISGNSGDNLLDGQGGADSLGGGGGADTLVGGQGADVLNGGSGNDVVSYQTAQTGVTASLANPSINAGDAAGDTLLSIERLLGSLFDDGLNGDGAVNIMFGSDGDDALKGYAADDALNGGSGNDTLFGGLGEDTLVGDAGFDAASYVGATAGVVASLSNASINRGEAAGDVYAAVENLVGTGFADVLNGDAVGNLIAGGAGNDSLKGYGGRDTLTGGAGADAFVFNTAPDAATNVDLITDFQTSVDRIWLDNAVFTQVGANGVLASGAFRIGAAAADASDRIIYNASTGALIYDSNGNQAGGATHFATLDPGLALANTNFQVI